MEEKQELRSYHLMSTPYLNKGTTFTSRQRDELGLRGLVPTAIFTLEQECDRVFAFLNTLADDFQRYIFMETIHDTNESLYYGLLFRFTDRLMPVVYTPTVGQGCTRFSEIYRTSPRGLYISYADKGHIEEILCHWPERNIKAIVFTDGERILGLGDLGANGMGIPIGKLALYTTCAGVHPQYCLPVTLDVGCNTSSIVNQAGYIGLKRDRLEGGHGTAYDELVSEFMTAAMRLYGRTVMLQFEDFGNKNAFRLLEDHQLTSCCFNDDVQGTASVILAGLLASTSITNVQLQHHVFLFHGAGEAGVGIANLIAYAINKQFGISLVDARSRIWLVDSKGLVTLNRRPKLEHHKLDYAHDHADCRTLLEAVQSIRPTALIGVSACPNEFTLEICHIMAANNANPIIFALSNPTSKAECTAAQAYDWTGGRAVFASGSPFPEYHNANGVLTKIPGQGNNSYIFPGIGLAVTSIGMTRLDDDDMYLAALELANQVTDDRLALGCLYPPLSDIRIVSARIATRIAEAAYVKGTASLMPKPADLHAFIQSNQYDPFRV